MAQPKKKQADRFEQVTTQCEPSVIGLIHKKWGSSRTGVYGSWGLGENEEAEEAFASEDYGEEIRVLGHGTVGVGEEGSNSDPQVREDGG